MNHSEGPYNTAGAAEFPNPNKGRQMLRDAWPWGENLMAKSLKKTHFIEHKKEKGSKIFEGGGRLGVFPSPS